MANTMQFDLVSPERRIATLEVSAVQIPGTDGDLTAMPGHAPLIRRFARVSFGSKAPKVRRNML